MKESLLLLEKRFRSENEIGRLVRKLLWGPRQETVVAWSAAVGVEVKGCGRCGQRHSRQDVLMD